MSDSQDKVEGEAVKEEDKEKEKVKETPAKERQGDVRDGRDWKRNGLLISGSIVLCKVILTDVIL